MDERDREYWEGWREAVEAAKELLYQRVEPRAADLLDELLNTPNQQHASSPSDD